MGHLPLIINLLGEPLMSWSLGFELLMCTDTLQEI